MSTELPQGWAKAKLSQIAILNPRHPKGFDDTLPVSFAPMSAISENGPSFEFLEERPLGDVRKGFTHFAEGDVLFAKITPCMENGKGAVATSLTNGLGYGTTELHVIRPLDGIDPRYIYHFLAQPRVRQEAKESFTGSAGQGRVPTSFIEELELPLAPAREQRRIVAKLETILTKVDNCRDRLTEIPKTLRRFRQSILTAACSGNLTADWRRQNPDVSLTDSDLQALGECRQAAWRHREFQRTGTKSSNGNYPDSFAPDLDEVPDLPLTWKPVSVSQVALLDVGFAFKSSEFSKQGLRLLRGENLEPGSLRWAEVRCWPKQKLKGFEHLLIEDGDIILAMDRPVISSGLKIARARQEDLPCLLVQRMTRFRMADKELTPFLYFNLSLPRFVAHLSKGLTGSDLPHITGTGVAEYSFGLPPRPEMHEIIRRVDELFRLADQIELRFASAKMRVNNLAQSVLAKAFKGELVAPEAELAEAEGRYFESAEELLQRVRSNDFDKAHESRTIRKLKKVPGHSKRRLNV